MSHVKDQNWVPAVVVAAGDLSHTFGSTTTTTENWIDCKGAVGVKFKATALTLGTAAGLRICPKFKDAAGNETYAADGDGDPRYVTIKTVGYETDVFWEVDAVSVSVELWTDVAAGVTGAATVALKRVTVAR